MMMMMIMVAMMTITTYNRDNGNCLSVVFDHLKLVSSQHVSGISAAPLSYMSIKFIKSLPVLLGKRG